MYVHVTMSPSAGPPHQPAAGRPATGTGSEGTIQVGWAHNQPTNQPPAVSTVRRMHKPSENALLYVCVALCAPPQFTHSTPSSPAYPLCITVLTLANSSSLPAHKMNFFFFLCVVLLACVSGASAQQSAMSMKARVEVYVSHDSGEQPRSAGTLVKVSRHARAAAALGNAPKSAVAPPAEVFSLAVGTPATSAAQVVALPAGEGASEARGLAASTTPISGCTPITNFPLTCRAGTSSWSWVACGNASFPWISSDPSLFALLRNPGGNFIDLLEFEGEKDVPTLTASSTPPDGCLETGTTNLDDGTCTQYSKAGYASTKPATLAIVTRQDGMGNAVSVVYIGCKGSGRVYLDYAAGTGLTSLPSNLNPSGTGVCSDRYDLLNVINGEGKFNKLSAWSPTSGSNFAVTSQWCLPPKDAEGSSTGVTFSTSYDRPVPGTTHT